MDNVVIKIEDLCKLYRLGSIGGRTLSQDLNSWFARILKREDPNRKIGSEYYNKSDKLLALDHINLEIKEGDTLGIIGPNGAGKSTLLKILSRVTAPTSGSVRVKGRIASLLEVGTGFHPELTGRENTYLNGAILGMSRTEIDRKLQDIIEFAEIARFIDTPVKRYSSGMYVRLAFAVAAHLEPEILVVDEVLAVGDYQFQQKCLGKMGDISKGGRTVLFVSHQLSMIKALCNKCILLDQGRLVKCGQTEEVVEAYINRKQSVNYVCHAEFAEDSGKEIAQVYRVSIKNRDGNEGSIYEIFEPILLEVEYEIKKPLVGVALGFSIYKNRGAVCHSFDTDINSQLLNRREPGRYLARVAIPPVLRAGNYVLDFTICRPGLDGIDFKQGVITFAVEEKTIDTSMCSYSTRRDGEFAVRQEWSHTRLDREKGEAV
jgi:lipopolysaccharide transport system ATP-binding protein